MWRQQVSSHYLSGTLPYVRRHITINKLLSASLNKTFPSFLPSGERELSKHDTGLPDVRQSKESARQVSASSPARER